MHDDKADVSAGHLVTNMQVLQYCVYSLQIILNEIVKSCFSAMQQLQK